MGGYPLPPGHGVLLSPVRGRLSAEVCRWDKLTRVCWTVAVHGDLTRLPGRGQGKNQEYSPVTRPRDPYRWSRGSRKNAARSSAREPKPAKPWTSTEKGVRVSQFSACHNAARIYGLTQPQPSDIIHRQVTTVREIGPRTPKSVSIP